VAVGDGWNYWRAVWAAWCPTCHQETMPFPSGRCGFCDTHLRGSSTRGPYDPLLIVGTGSDASAPVILGTPTLKAA
jgi:hypothetical protein